MTFLACTFCGVKSLPTDRHTFDLIRLRNGRSVDLYFCEKCSGTLHVALAWAYDHGGLAPPEAQRALTLCDGGVVFLKHRNATMRLVIRSIDVARGMYGAVKATFTGEGHEV